MEIGLERVWGTHSRSRSPGFRVGAVAAVRCATAPTCRVQSSLSWGKRAPSSQHWNPGRGPPTRAGAASLCRLGLSPVGDKTERLAYRLCKGPSGIERTTQTRPATASADRDRHRAEKTGLGTQPLRDQAGSGQTASLPPGIRADWMGQTWGRMMENKLPRDHFFFLS